MFDHCLYFNTTALARLLEREWTRAFKQFGLTPSQAFMLRVVLEKPSLLQRELAKELVISRPTATRTLDGLQKMQLVERMPRIAAAVFLHRFARWVIKCGSRRRRRRRPCA
jgi:DNA-binding MarR family transcriptional regulator